MKSEPLVSIIVAVYNGEKFLKKCLNSIIDQTYRNLEIILIDDGSPDKCPEICDEYAKKDARIKVVHQKNAGTCASRNVGLGKAKGDYICIMDQDDFIAKDYVEYLLGLALENKAEIALVPHVVFVKGDEKIFRDKEPDTKVEIWDGEKAAREMLYMNIDIGPWNKIISKKMIDEKGLKFNNKLFGGEGFTFSVSCFMESKKIAVGHKGVYFYRIDNYSSEMSDYRPRTAESSFLALKIMREMFYGKTKALDEALDYASWEVYGVFLSSMIFAGARKKYPAEYKKYRENLLKKFKLRFMFNEAPLKHRVKNFLCTFAPGALGVAAKLGNVGLREYNEKRRK